MAENARIYFAVDDTDNETSMGTGGFARKARREMAAEGLASSLGVARHQLLVHPDIPYTSHNSAASVEIELHAPLAKIIDFLENFMKDNFHEGADPGLCVLPVEDWSPELEEFGRRAQKVVLKKSDAEALARERGIYLKEFGGEGIGVIGALGAVGLRGGGNDGRFIGLKGIRDVGRVLTVGEILEKTGVDIVATADRAPLPPDTVIDTFNWLRSVNIGHEKVYIVEPLPDGRYKPVGKDKPKIKKRRDEGEPHGKL